jgi:hypothetical protein
MSYNYKEKSFNLTATKMRKWHMDVHAKTHDDCIICRGNFDEIVPWLESNGFKIMDHGTNWLKIYATTNYRPTHGGSTDESNRLYCFIAGYADLTCEQCGRPMVIRFGKHGKFHGCSGYPKCTNTKFLTFRHDIYQPLHDKKNGVR